MIRTLVCATSDLARAGLVAIVRGDARLVLAGESSPESLAVRVRALDPDVVLEERAPFAATLATPSVALVDDPALALATERDAGGERSAHAILTRDASPGEIVAAIIAVAAGLVAYQPRALGFAPARSRDDRAFDNAPPNHVPMDDIGEDRIGTISRGERLTPREIDVLGELARGVPNKTIASRLHISEHTVKFHIASIFAKLSVASRTEAVTQGVRLGLIML